jgi:hypothetical protein
MSTPNQTFSINLEFLHKNWKVGQIVENASDRTQFEIVDFDRGRVLLRLLPDDERIEPELLLFRLNVNPKPLTEETMKTITFKIRNIATTETLSFDAEYLENALDMASLHFFGEIPVEKICDEHERYTLLRNADNGNVIGRLIVIGIPA